MPDLKVYVNADPNAPTGQAEVLQRGAGRGPAGGARRRHGPAWKPRTGGPPNRSRPTSSSIRRSCSSPYGSPRYEKPFLVRSIWHDGQFTYIKADATELPALYEVKDGKPALLNFQVHQGHVRGAEGGGRGLPGARQGALHVLAARAVTYGRDASRCLDIAATPAIAAPAVTDRRPSPRGVLPRGVQTWLMAGLAAFMLVIMFVVGRPEAPARPAAAAGSRQAPSADRVRDYQDRLRALEAQSVSQLADQQAAPAADPRAYSEPQVAAAAGSDRGPRSGGASTRASLPATSCSAGDRRPSGRTSAEPRRVGASAGEFGRRAADRWTRSPTPRFAPPHEPRASVRPESQARGCHSRCQADAGNGGDSAPGQPRTPERHRPDQRRRAAAPDPRRHDHRRRPHESPRRDHCGARELPGHESALLAQRAARRHSGRRSRARRDEAGSELSARRGWPSRFTGC